MKRSLRILVYVLGAVIAVSSCRNKQQKQEENEATQVQIVKTPDFNADSSYAYVAQQVAFGPRIPNSSGHRRCGDYLIAKLKQYGVEVTIQAFTATAYDGTKLNARNIIGSINPKATKRILLAAHWDTRPYADQDSTDKNSPIQGANDGASGIGVLLELARSIQGSPQKPNVGIDMIFFDVEDYGIPAFTNARSDEYSGYCLGSRYWAANRHVPNYSAYYGILLDMVGAKNATFLKEGLSKKYAATIQNTIWTIASEMGYNRYFVPEPEAGELIDDHKPINEVAKIPMVDIIHLDPSDNSFFEHWHTHDDTMENIDRTTLKAVGQVLLQTIYREE